MEATMPEARSPCREFGSLTTLRQVGLAIAPEPILLDRETYQQPVIVQSWLDGRVSAEPPVAEPKWQRLVEHLVLVRSVTPHATALSLPWATINADNAVQGQERVLDQVAQIPVRARPGSLTSILPLFTGHDFPTWSKAPVTLCRLDNNLTNYVRRPGPWASVDWEYSGWGDPAFEVANLVTHVACKDVPPSRWQCLLQPG
jgi:aminoglycoside phosphotransferase (APT) family kinase protein